MQSSAGQRISSKCVVILFRPRSKRYQYKQICIDLQYKSVSLLYYM